MCAHINLLLQICVSRQPHPTLLLYGAEFAECRLWNAACFCAAGARSAGACWHTLRSIVHNHVEVTRWVRLRARPRQQGRRRIRGAVHYPSRPPRGADALISASFIALISEVCSGKGSTRRTELWSQIQKLSSKGCAIVAVSTLKVTFLILMCIKCIF